MVGGGGKKRAWEGIGRGEDERDAYRRDGIVERARAMEEECVAGSLGAQKNVSEAKRVEGARTHGRDGAA